MSDSHRAGKLIKSLLSKEKHIIHPTFQCNIMHSNGHSHTDVEDMF